MNGRLYLVAPVVMIVPGVLAGSRGPLLYPEEEVSRNVASWNGIALTVRHPTVNGQPVSVNAPGVYDRFAVGMIRNAVYNGRLQAEAWVDVLLAKKIDSRILNILQSGGSLEVSTGLFTQNDKAKPGSRYKDGREYSYIARNYRPDHLALLPDETGACSIKDGCGLNINQNANQNALNSLQTFLKSKGIAMDKTQMIDWLVANCSCWKGDKDKEVLNSFDENKIKQLVAEVQANQTLATNHAQVVTALTNGFVINGAKVTYDATTGQFKAEAVNPTPTPTPQLLDIKVGTPTPTNNKSFLELLNETGSEEDKATWNTAVQLAQEKKKALVNQLTANMKAEAKAAAETVYTAMKTVDLEKLVAALPVKPTQNNSPRFDLNPGAPIGNNTPAKVRTGLSLPITTFANPLKK